jgi:hypothetical protein
MMEKWGLQMRMVLGLDRGCGETLVTGREDL